MNKENIRWVSLESSKKPEKKFVEIAQEAKNEFNEAEATEEKTNKQIVLENTLVEAVLTMMKKKLAVNESTKSSQSGEDLPTTLAETASWKDFELMGRTIAGFMEEDTGKIDAVIKKIREAFTALGGGSADKGVENLINIDSALVKAGINGNVKPTINAARFLDILKDDIVNVGKGKNRHKETITYSVQTLVEILLTRDNRRVADFLAKCEDGKQAAKTIEESLLGVIKNAVGKAKNKIHSDKDEVAKVLWKIMKANWYEKNGGKIGKGEIALAMFFGDCHLADEEGDLVIGGQGSRQNIEVKGHEAVITERLDWNTFNRIFNKSKTTTDTFKNNATKEREFVKNLKISSDINSMSLKDIWKIKEDIDKNAIKSPSSTQKMKANERRIIDKPLDDSDENLPIGKPEGKRANLKNTTSDLDLTELYFKVVFGLVFRKYMQSKVKGRMMIINTKEYTGDVIDPTASLFLLDIPAILKIKNEKDWFLDGVSALNELKSKNITVYFGQRAGTEGGFKVKFKGKGERG